MLTIEQVAGIASSAMTEPQARALYRILYGAEREAKADTMAILGVNRVNRFEAHRILNYVLTHMMSDEDNARYVKDQLGLGE